MPQVEEAIVLAGGLGTRLRAEVPDLPKPLAPVAGRPFLAWLLDALVAAGIRRTILATGHLSGQIERAIGRDWLGMRVDYSVEEGAMGTGGAIALAARGLHGSHVHVANGDTYLRFDFRALESVLRRERAAIGMALARVPDVGRYGAVELQGERAIGFREKGGTGEGWINAGSYLLAPEAIAAFPAAPAFSFEDAVLRPAARAGDVVVLRETREFIDIGVPEDFRRAQHRFVRRFVDPAAEAMLSAAPAPRRALFLDRDGVINANHGYVHTPEATDWIEGVFDLVRSARDAGLLPIVVTNQAGIGRGLYDEAAFLEYTRWVHAEFAARGAPLLATFYCPHHAEAGLGEWRIECACRKPAPGMLVAAADGFALDLAGSLMLGDAATDLEAAERAGIGRGVLLGRDVPTLAMAQSLLSPA